jgi:hypothetical protein
VNATPDPGEGKLTKMYSTYKPVFQPFKRLVYLPVRTVVMFYDLYKEYFHVKISILVTAKSDRDPDSHWFGSLDPDSDPHCNKKLDPDQH